MDAPVLLDLYCCIGGAAVGYARAGWTVIGVDWLPQPDYPFEFHQGDALTLGYELATRATAIHASPPCQGEGAIAKGNAPRLAELHPRLIPATRRMLDDIGLPYVIENVAGADIRKDVTLCGETFGLGVIMHRYFELSGWTTTSPPHSPHRGRVRGWRHGEYFDGPYVAAYGNGGGKATVAEMQTAKDIDWTVEHLGLREALPPAYTEWLGRRWLDALASTSRTSGASAATSGS